MEEPWNRLHVSRQCITQKVRQLFLFLSSPSFSSTSFHPPLFYPLSPQHTDEMNPRKVNLTKEQTVLYLDNAMHKSASFFFLSSFSLPPSPPPPPPPLSLFLFSLYLFLSVPSKHRKEMCGGEMNFTQEQTVMYLDNVLYKKGRQLFLSSLIAFLSHPPSASSPSSSLSAPLSPPNTQRKCVVGK